MKARYIILVLVVIATVFYFVNSKSEKQQPQANSQPQAMPVTIETVQPEPVQIWQTFSGRITAVDYAEIRPQVGGTITEIRFKDGQQVEKGKILFVIDPRPYKAAVAEARAALASAQDQASLAQKTFKRTQGLIKTDSISRKVYDERNNAVKTSQAAVASARATLEQANINLDYAYVKAPISGVVSRAEITEGNLVQSSPNAPLLTTIVSVNGVYADFDIDEQTYLQRIRGIKEIPTIPVELRLNSGDEVYEGFLKSIDNRLNDTTGTIRARAFFENKEYSLLPGMFAEVRLTSPVEEEHILVPERAINTNQDRKFVYVVEDGKAMPRPVTLGSSLKGHRVIASGLEPGDKVITEGVIRLRPNTPVTIQTENKE